MIEELLYSTLSADSAVAAAFAGRIYPDIADHYDAYPLCTYFVVSSEPYQGICKNSGWNRARVQFTVHAPLRKNARLAAKTITAALDRKTITTTNCVMDDCTLIQERSTYSDEPHPEGFASVELDFEIIYQEL